MIGLLDTASAGCQRIATAISAALKAVALVLLVGACAAPGNAPSNTALEQSLASTERASIGKPSRTSVILAFSGGGARSAAFGYGVLSALSEQPSPDDPGRTLADDVVAVAGVSGGGILAAHFALYGPRGLPDFRRRFLDGDAEAALRTSYSPVNLLRAYRGGINDLTGFAAWLDAQLYRGATLGDLDRSDGPRLILHATDLYNRAPFPFDRPSFVAICSDYDRFPLAHAVAASSAVPVVFAPIVLKNFNPSCPVSRPRMTPPPPGQSLFDSHLAASQMRYASAPDLRYLKLLDGGLVDNLAARNLARTLAWPAPAPLPPATARSVEQILVIVVDASMRVGGDISDTLEGPEAPETIVAAADAMIDGASRMSLDVLKRETRRWRDRLARWRCSFRTPRPGCDKLSVTLVSLSLADIGGEVEKSRILRLHNKLSLPSDDVDFLSGLGRRLLREQPAYRRLTGSR